METKEITGLRLIGCEIEPCGSRVTCDPPPVDTDQDYLVVVPPHAVADAVSVLVENGFRWEGSEHYQDVAASDFMSWRKGEANMIVTANTEFVRKWRAATYVAKRLNLLRKSDRISLFQAVLYGRQWSDADD